MNRPKLFNFMIAVMLTLAAITFALVEHDNLIRRLFGLLLVCVLPGYAAMTAWFPRRLTKYPGNVLFILALSLSITSLGGLVMHKTPWGITIPSMALGLGGFTLINLAIAWFRGGAIFVNRRDIDLTLPVYQMVMIVCAIFISVFALYMGRQGTLNSDQPGFTQMWMLQADEGFAIEMGVRNYERQTVTYKLVIKTDASTIEENFELDADETWEKRFPLPTSTTGEVNAYLSRSEAPHAVYRSTSLWLQPTE